MSLARIALRIAAVEAIRGRTLVADNVLDSPNGALDIQSDGALRTAEDKPFVSVFTDQGKVERITGRSLVENGLVDIVFEAGLSAAMLDTDPDTGATTMVGVSVPASDSGFEFFLDVVQRQIADALNDPNNAWAEIYRGLHLGVVKVEYAGARNADDGQRLAGHQMRLTVELVDDPVVGEAMDPDAPFIQFLERLEASGDTTYETQAATIRALIEGTSTPLEDLRRRHGFTAAEVGALGLSPLDADGEDAGDLSVEVDGLGTQQVTE